MNGYRTVCYGRQGSKKGVWHKGCTDLIASLTSRGFQVCSFCQKNRLMLLLSQCNLLHITLTVYCQIGYQKNPLTTDLIGVGQPLRLVRFYKFHLGFI